MKRENNNRILRTVVVFCLAGLYFVLAMTVTLLGSSIYRGVAASADETSKQRIALSYVANQIRRSGEGVTLGSFEGCETLRLSETTPEGYVYVTYIYRYDGQLMELYTEEGSGLKPEDGTALIGLDSLEFSAGDGLLTITAEGHSLTLYPDGGLEEVEEL